jgi:hypothetical protein
MNTVAPAARELFEIASSHAPNATGCSERPLVSQTMRSGVGALTALLARHLTAFLQKANRVANSALSSEKSTQSSPVLSIDGMFLFDAMAADELESTGPYGADLADEVRSSARERWLRDLATFENTGCFSVEFTHYWSPTQRGGLVRFASLLANALWHDVIEPRLREAKHPALSLEVIEKIESAFWSRDRRIETHGIGSVIKIDRGSSRACERATGRQNYRPKCSIAYLLHAA